MLFSPHLTAPTRGYGIRVENSFDFRVITRLLIKFMSDQMVGLLEELLENFEHRFDPAQLQLTARY